MRPVLRAYASTSFRDRLPSGWVASTFVDGIVLVHGAWVRSACWDLVAPALRDRGHRVEVVELHRGSLTADTCVAQEQVDAVGGPVLVCGWSYGGMVITGLELPAGSRLVYVCAFMPDEGESAVSLSERLPAELDQILGVDAAGDFVLEGSEVDEIGWADAPADRAAMARASLRSQSASSLAGSPARIAWRSVPSTYVVGRRDRVVHPELQREMAQRATHVVEWETSHSPMLAKPDLVIDLLDNLVIQG